MAVRDIAHFITIPFAMTLTVFVIGGSPAAAENVSIYQAIVADANQKTAEVSTEELRRILADRSAIVLDTRTRAEFDAGHIPGARNLDAPASAQVAAVETLVNGDKSKALVLYCNGPYCQASRRVAEQLVTAGFTNVRRYQLGIPIWRALGGPTEVELSGITRIFGADRTAVFLDGRTPDQFAQRSISGAHNVPVAELASGKLTKVPLPEDDFNRRIILFGGDAGEARNLAELLSKRPWHNIAFFAGSFETLSAAVQPK
jgi:rhodanese-related sulfurtransferase